VSTQKPTPMNVDGLMSEKKPITKKHFIEHEENETPRKKPKISNYRNNSVSFSVEQLSELREKFKEEINNNLWTYKRASEILGVSDSDLSSFINGCKKIKIPVQIAKYFELKTFEDALCLVQSRESGPIKIVICSALDVALKKIENISDGNPKSLQVKYTRFGKFSPDILPRIRNLLGGYKCQQEDWFDTNLINVITAVETILSDLTVNAFEILTNKTNVSISGKDEKIINIV